MAFYKLYKSFREDPERFVPTWEFGGEMYVSELDKWVLMSYKCPTRLSDIMRKNPDLLQRQEVVGRSNSRYYAYKIRQGVQAKHVLDPILSEFYNKIKWKGTTVEILPRTEGIKTTALSKCCQAPILKDSKKCSKCMNGLKNSGRVFYKGKILWLGVPNSLGTVTLWEGLPDNPEPYTEVSETEAQALTRVGTCAICGQDEVAGQPHPNCYNQI